MILWILLLSLVLRFLSLNQSFWLDEGTSALLARDFSFERILSQFSPGDFHPPFYYLALKAWSSLFGYSEVSLRSLSVLAGVASIYLTFLIAKRLLGTKAGVLSALFLATSGLHIYYSQEARMYIVSAFFVVALVYFFLKIIGKGKFLDWLAFSTLLLLNGLTDYLPNLIIAVFFFYAFLLRKDWVWWRKFLLAHIPLVVGYLLFLPTLSSQLSAGLEVQASTPNWWRVLGKTNFKEMALIPVKFALGRISFIDKKLYALVAGGILLVYSLVSLRLENLKNERLKIVWLWLVIPTLLAAALGLKISVFSYFRLIFVLPAFFILLAAGVVSLKKKFYLPALVFILAVNILSSFAYLLNPRFQREDWRGLVVFIERESKEDSIVVFVKGQTEAYKYYAKDAKIASPEDLGGSHSEIWLMRYVQPIFDPKDKVRQKIEGLGYKKVKEYDFNGVVVWRYEK